MKLTPAELACGVLRLEVDGTIEVAEAIRAWGLPYTTGVAVECIRRSDLANPAASLALLEAAAWFLSLAIRDAAAAAAKAESDE